MIIFTSKRNQIVIVKDASVIQREGRENGTNIVPAWFVHYEIAKTALNKIVIIIKFQGVQEVPCFADSRWFYIVHVGKIFSRYNVRILNAFKEFL